MILRNYDSAMIALKDGLPALRPTKQVFMRDLAEDLGRQLIAKMEQAWPEYSAYCIHSPERYPYVADYAKVQLLIHFLMDLLREKHGPLSNDEGKLLADHSTVRERLHHTTDDDPLMGRRGDFYVPMLVQLHYLFYFITEEMGPEYWGLTSGIPAYAVIAEAARKIVQRQIVEHQTAKPEEYNEKVYQFVREQVATTFHHTKMEKHQRVQRLLGVALDIIDNEEQSLVLEEELDEALAGLEEENVPA